MPQEFLWSFRRAGEVKFMKASDPSSPLPWIVHRGDWEGLCQAFSPLWSYIRYKKGAASPQVMAACGGGLYRRAAEGNVQNAKGAAEKVHVPSAGGGS